MKNVNKLSSANAKATNSDFGKPTCSELILGDVAIAISRDPYDEDKKPTIQIGGWCRKKIYLPFTYSLTDKQLDNLEDMIKSCRSS